MSEVAASGKELPVIKLKSIDSMVCGVDIESHEITQGGYIKPLPPSPFFSRSSKAFFCNIRLINYLFTPNLFRLLSSLHTSRSSFFLSLNKITRDVITLTSDEDPCLRCKGCTKFDYRQLAYTDGCEGCLYGSKHRQLA